MYKYQLPKEFAEKWVAALRSGGYQQIKHDYHTVGNCYCGAGLGYLIGGATVKRGYVLNISPCLNTFWKVKGDIVELNDSKDKSFSEIADWIESNIEFVESEADHV